MPHITIIIPIFNEETNILPMADAIHRVFLTLPHTYTMLFIDDGSTDNTWSTLSKRQAHDNAIRGIRLTRNFGHQAALLAGIHHATGDALITMDGDLQHPPTVLPQLVHSWETGSKLVCTKRKEQIVQSLVKSFLSTLYYRVQAYLIAPRHDLGTSDFRLLDHSIQQYLLTFPHGKLNLRSALQYSGYPATIVTYEVGLRHSGHSKFTLLKMLHLATAGIIPFSVFPLYLSVLFSISSIFVAIFSTLLLSASGPTSRSQNNIYTRASAFLYILSPIILLQSTIAWYISDVHFTVHNYPRYIIDQFLGFPTIVPTTAGQGRHS